MRTKKRILFHGEAKTSKNGQKRTKNGYGVTPSLGITIFRVPQPAPLDLGTMQPLNPSLVGLVIGLCFVSLWIFCNCQSAIEKKSFVMDYITKEIMLGNVPTFHHIKISL